MNFVIRPEDETRLDECGGKAGALAALIPAHLPVPPWFVLSPHARAVGLGESAQQAAELAAPEARDAAAPQLVAELAAPEARDAAGSVILDETVLRELRTALYELCPRGEPVAVRSSATDEDGTGHSFAGQFDTFLFVRHEDVPARVQDVWRSGNSERVLAYRREHNLPQASRPPAILIQRMVHASQAGVAFGVDPVSGRHSVAVVAAVYGLGTALVSGEADADTFHIDRSGAIVQRELAHKRVMHRCNVGGAGAAGVVTVEVPPEQAAEPVLTDAQVQEVAALVRRTGRHFGQPQDIEWAIEEGQLYLLQSRPVTAAADVADPEATLNIWDNSNIAESYSGLTTPLTFSFARHVYAEVYRQFSGLMGVPASVINARDDVFGHMLGLIRGRIYYNLLNWYRLLALLPGFTINRRFMEQMMGVREALPVHIIAALGTPARGTRRERLADAWRLFSTLRGLHRNYRQLPVLIERFYARLEKALNAGGDAHDDAANLALMRADELVEYYRGLERQLLKRWDAPLINDFLAMVFYGTLGKLCEQWCGDADGALRNQLLSGGGGMISLEPAARVCAMASLTAGDPEFARLLGAGSVAAIQREMPRRPAFKAAYDAYLQKFGERCLEELKLESSTLHDDPLPLLRSIGQLAQGGSGHEPPVGQPPLGQPLGGQPRTDPLRRQAEQRVTQALRGSMLRRRVFAWVLPNARARVRDRENLRFARTRVFGRVRRIFVELGRRLHGAGLLHEPRDVFYLEVDEVLGIVEGTASSTDLKGLVSVRRTEFERFRDLPAPADRFETRGLVYSGNSFLAAPPVSGPDIAEAPGGDTRRGIGCGVGVVRGPVRVVRDPGQAMLRHGEILVAERTDPGWVMLFPAASGLLVERGSLLSHSAIVAREMGLPAIVALPDVTHWLKDGDLVEMDGASGLVRRLTDGEAGADGL